MSPRRRGAALLDAGDGLEEMSRLARADGFSTKEFSRRGFLTSALGAGGALVVGLQLAPGLGFLERAGATGAGGTLGVYVTVGADGSITITCPNAEMGQGTSTALPMLVAEELMVDWSAVRMVLGGYDPALNRPTNGTTLGTSQSTGGSTAVRSYHDYLRNVGATARQKLIWAANSLDPSIPIADLKADAGRVVRISTGAVVGTYGDLAATAVGMNPNDVAWVRPPYRFIGQPMPRLDLGAKVNGSAVFGIDVRLDGMRYAAVKQAPKVGQTVGAVGNAPSGTQVVTVPGGVAVIADGSTWTAMQAARNLSVTWVDAPTTASVDSAQMRAKAEALLVTGPALATTPVVGDAPGVLAAAPLTQKFTGVFSTPYLAHATLEPMNATALVTDTTCEIWAPTQVQTKCVQAAAAITGLPLSAITLHTTYLGGGLGRRLETDYVKQAVTVAQAVKGTPVKLVWSREEDFTHDVYRPCSLVQMDAAVDGSGTITALKARIVSPSVRAYQGALTPGTADASAADGMVNAVYNVPNRLVEWVQDPSPVPVGWWRSIGVSQNCFVLESFLDDIATQTGQDPFTLRKNLCNQGTEIHRRVGTVLDRLRADSAWDSAPPSGYARGLALCVGFGNTVVGMVAEVAGAFGIGFKVGRITAVVDPGTAINPDTIRAQIEGAIHQGLGAAMWQQMTFTAGTPDHRNFDTYKVGRMRDYPANVNVTIVESGAALGGIGEPGVPPVAPAITNAIAKLTGFRLRGLPIAAQAGPTPPPTTTTTAPAVTTTRPTTTSTTRPTTSTTRPITTSTTRPLVTTTLPVVGGPTIKTFTPSSGRIGTTVTLTGTNFTGATSVTIGGVAAAFTVSGSTKITFRIPTGARTGKIAVTTPKGIATTRDTFSVDR